MRRNSAAEVLAASKKRGAKKRVAVRQTLGVDAQTAISLRKPYVKKRKSNKSVSFKSVKKVKVSGALRAKINKVIESKQVHGRYGQREVGYLNNNHFMNRQANGHTVIGTYTNWAFHPENFLHYASVLWKKKGAYQAGTGRQWGNEENIGHTVYPNVNPNPKNIYANAAMFEVKWSKECYNLKNNSQVTRTVTVILCAPKQVHSSNDAPRAAVGTTGVDSARIQSPYDFWDTCLTTAALEGLNIAQIDSNFMGARPYHLAAWNKYFSYEETTIVIEPGQTFCFEVKGPSNMQFDMKKYFKGAYFQDIQKFCRYPMFIMHGEMSQDAVIETKIGWSTGSAITGRGELIFERVFDCALSMPETVGAQVETYTAPVVGMTQGKLELNLRKPVFAYYNYGTQDDYAEGTVRSVQKIDETNPQQPIVTLG